MILNKPLRAKLLPFLPKISGKEAMAHHKSQLKILAQTLLARGYKELKTYIDLSSYFFIYTRGKESLHMQVTTRSDNHPNRNAPVLSICNELYLCVSDREEDNNFVNQFITFYTISVFSCTTPNRNAKLINYTLEDYYESN